MDTVTSLHRFPQTLDQRRVRVAELAGFDGFYTASYRRVVG